MAFILCRPRYSADANANHFFNSLDTTTFHSGTQSLMLEMQGYADNSCCAQNVLNMVGMSQPINSLYERIWVKLGPEVAQQIAAHPSNFWRDLFEIKTQSDFRIITYVYKNNNQLQSLLFCSIRQWGAEFSDPNILAIELSSIERLQRCCSTESMVS